MMYIVKIPESRILAEVYLARDIGLLLKSLELLGLLFKLTICGEAWRHLQLVVGWKTIIFKV
jgi:hypothetical protein